MESSVGLRLLKAICFASCAFASLIIGQAKGAVWIEIPDAGDLTSTAQATSGVGSLDAITGALDSAFDDIDMFAVFIADLSLFSATTDTPETNDLLDTSLFLFDSTGKGVAANGDIDIDLLNFFSRIPSGSLSGGSRIYYLAISTFDDKPVSSSGEIFPDLFTDSSSGQVVGPIGPGGSAPISHWAIDGDRYPVEAYRIALTGAEPLSPSVIPEPSSLVVWSLLVGLGSVFGGYKRRKR